MIVPDKLKKGDIVRVITPVRRGESAVTEMETRVTPS
jgi:hypothetical protein